MAHLNNHFPRNRKPSTLESIGNKIRSVAELAGTAKGIYDAGRALYSFGQTVGPMIGPVIRGASLLL
jgi:hypothetical protein